METRYGVGKLKVPDGFAGMLERFAREVLRKQPLNISEFGAEYFQEQLRKRDDTGFDPMTHDIDVEKRRYNDEHFGTKGDYPLKATHKEERAAVQIQAGYRGYKGRRQVEHLKEQQELEHAAVKIQANFKGFKTRREMKEHKENKSNLKDVENTKEENVSMENSSSREEDAATRIQSTFRGHQTRKNIQLEREQHAATKIQAQFRGHQTRKQYSKQDIAESHNVDDEPQKMDDKITSEETSLPKEEYEVKHEEEILVTRGSLVQEEYEMVHEEEEVLKKQEGSLSQEEYEMKEEEEEANDEKLEENTQNLVIQDEKVDEAITTNVANEEDVQATNDGSETPEEKEEDQLDKLKQELEEATGGVKEEEHDVKQTADDMDAKPTTAVMGAGDAQIQDDDTLNLQESEKHKAAVQIQSHYRGYRARKEYPQKQYGAKKEESGDAV